MTTRVPCHHRLDESHPISICEHQMMPLTCVPSLNILPNSFVLRQSTTSTLPLVRAYGHKFSIMVARPVLMRNLTFPPRTNRETRSSSWNLLLIP